MKRFAQGEEYQMAEQGTLQLYHGEKQTAIKLIKGFWKAHNNEDQTDAEALKDLEAWTAEGHRFYFIRLAQEFVGFLHLGNRGGKPDWIEDVFVLPAYQNRGIGTSAIREAIQEIRSYSESVYIEAAARNKGAIRLYRKLGFDCLNTVTLRHDFQAPNFEVLRTETIYDREFEIRRKKQS